MAKRKRTPATTATTRKRQKRHPHGEFDSQKEYKIKSIIDEDKTRYRISWEDDEETGEHYLPTWEPKDFANQLAVEDWEKQKAGRRGETSINGELDTSNSRRLSLEVQGIADPPKKRGRPRKVVESSPPPAVLGDQNDERVEPATEGFIEIGESQQSEPDAEGGPAPATPASGSPLFVPAESPHPVRSSDESLVAVQNPEPPSSYLNGAYEAIDSSQADQTSSVPPRKNSPEPSHYVPDPAETTGTTEITEGTTLALTTPSQQPQSVPVNFDVSTSKVVPDSQRLHPSSSYVPSAATSKSSALESRVQPSNSGQLDFASNRDQGRLQAPARDGDHSSGSGIHELRQSINDASHDHNPQRSVQLSGPSDSLNLEQEKNTSQFEPAHVKDNSAVAKASPESSDNTEDQANSNFETAHTLTTPTTGDSDQIQEAPLTANTETGYERSNSTAGSASAEDQLHQPASGSSSRRDLADSEAPRQSIEKPDREPEQSSVENLYQSSNILESTQQQRLNDHIDLCATTQGQSSGGGFTVTPQPRNHVSDTYSHFRPPTTASSTWLSSSFPFKTQVSANFNNRNHPETSVRENESRQSQPLQNDYGTLTQLSTITPRASSAPLASLSQAPPLSQLPQPPSSLVAQGSLGPGPAPSRSVNSTPKTNRVMETTESTPSTGSTIREKLQARREQRKRELRNEASTSSPAVPSVQHPNSELQSPAVNPITAGVLPLNPARLASPAVLANDNARSPSTVPAQAPLPVITEELNMSARYETLLPQAHDPTATERLRNGSLTTGGIPAHVNNSEDHPEKANLYTIPIALIGHQRDQYPQMVWYYRQTIDDFLGTPDPDDEMVQNAKRVVQRVRNIAMHPDLDNVETLTQHDVVASQQADWDVKCSAKFHFLDELLDRLRDQELHIAIVSSPGRIVDMLGTFLSGTGIQPRRQTDAEPSSPQSVENKLRVTLLSTDDEPGSTQVADVVIALDNLVRHDTVAISAFRQRRGKWAPFVTLVVPYTIEHVERCLSPNLSDRALARALVSGIYLLRSKAGKLEEGQLALEDAAAALAEYLVSEEPEIEWPLAPLGTLEDLDSQTESEIEPVENGTINSVQAGSKRVHELDDEDVEEAGVSKKIRVQPPSSSHGLDVTHVSDSVDTSTQRNALGQKAEVANPPSTSTEDRLQRLLIESEKQLAEHKEALGDLQSRHEDQRNRLVDITKERDDAITTAQHAVTRLSEQSSIRAKNRELEQQLKEANERLLEHSVPERAEFEALRLSTAQANAEKEKIEKRLEQANKDLSYVRDLYQGSSSSAQQLATQNSELENKLAVTENKATGEQARLRQMGYDTYAKNLQKENKKLKDVLKNRDAAVHFRDEEIAKLKDASRGRMGTRGTSVPRSPRMGSPMKMGSRQGSPAAGELRGRIGLLHPLRNA